jgi:ABC-type transporter Mla subunit MlaD
MGWRDLIALPRRVARMDTNMEAVMATLDDVKAQLAEANSATDNIADDVSRLKDKIDQAIADTQGQVDAAVSAALQEVSDELGGHVSRLQAVAAETPEDAEAPAEGGVDVTPVEGSPAADEVATEDDNA